ncbi:MAG TPA: tetratricopeptide repeat protein [Bacteriovoracaceae bacterium]|nr:tetratricopeptide repeat protein [Bacteriovoracaceae bacterium]
MNTFFPATLLSSVVMMSSCSRSAPGDHQSYRYKLPVNIATQEVFAPSGDLNNHSYLIEKGEHEFKLARRTGDEEKLQQAEELAKKSLTLLPKGNQHAKLLLAQVIETRHQFAQAITLAEEALTETPGSRKAHLILITSHLALGNLEQASTYADQLIKDFPRVGTLSLRGLVLLSQGRDEEAVFDLKKSIEVEDLGETAESTWARCVLARHLLERDQDEDANFLLTEALRITPESPLALDLMAQILAQKGEYEKSHQFFDRAFATSRQLAHLRHQAELNDQTGKRTLALDQWGQVEKLIREELAEKRFDHRIDLAKVLLMRKAGGDLREAVSLILQELELRQNSETYYLLARGYFDLGFNQQALTSMLAFHRKGPRSGRAYLLTAEIYQKDGNKKRAEVYSNLARSLESDVNRINFL